MTHTKTERAEKLDATGFDFSPFVNQSGIVENVIIVHAGGAQESSGYSTDIWSHQWEIDDGKGVTVNGGYKIVQYTMLSEDSPLGIFCHEFGHTLGLPDLYDTSVFGGLKVVGTWCLMDYGSWIDSGNHPSHISGWGKTYLQWGNTVSVQGNNLPLYPSSEMSQTQTPTFYKIPILGSQTEYFLLEYRRNNGSTVYDVDIATSGIVVWHVDEDKWNEVINGTTRWDENTINTDAKHRSVSVVQAQTGSIGSVTDVFGWNVYDLIPSKSNGYRGSSDMVVTDMMDAGTRVMTLNISPYSPQSQLIVTLYNYPNPVNTSTTIHIVTSKFVLKGALRIYTLSGELVYDEDVDGEKYTHTKSSENASVYEFVWDGTNLQGERLASGVYFCVFSSDGAHRSAKIAVIR